MRVPALLLVPLAFVSLPTGAAFAQDPFGGAAPEADPAAPQVSSPAHTPDPSARQVRSVGRIVGGSVLITLGILGVAGSAAAFYQANLSDDCARHTGFGGIACAFGEVGKGAGNVLALSLGLLGVGALGGGVALVVTGAQRPRPSWALQTPRAMPEVSLGAGTLSLKWSF
jgi:hypothetical protein